MVSSEDPASPGQTQTPREITKDLVLSLLQKQHPDLAHKPLSFLARGWDNTLFRLGPDMVVRMPHRDLAATFLQHEVRWLPLLAPRLPIPVPVPLRSGVPDTDYPWPFSIQPWLPGTPLERITPTARTLSPQAPCQAPAQNLRSDQPRRFADFLLALHQPAPSAAPHNPYRGVPLAERQPAIHTRLIDLQSKTAVITPHVLTAWQQALAAPATYRREWIHGDLHAGNVLVQANTLSAVIDWGDLNAGDCASDVAAFWLLFEPDDLREAALNYYLQARCNPPGLRARALGWAIAFASLLMHDGAHDVQAQGQYGRRIFERVQRTPNLEP